MFKLKSPCATCPFRRGVGELFQFSAMRFQEIVEAPAFQCHRTVDYDDDPSGRGRQGERPQQCAGLMAMLHREYADNQIMQVAQRFGAFDPAELDPRGEAYASFAEAFEAHRCGDLR